MAASNLIISWQYLQIASLHSLLTANRCKQWTSRLQGIDCLSQSLYWLRITHLSIKVSTEIKIRKAAKWTTIINSSSSRSCKMILCLLAQPLQKLSGSCKRRNLDWIRLSARRFSRSRRRSELTRQKRLSCPWIRILKRNRRLKITKTILNTGVSKSALWTTIRPWYTSILKTTDSIWSLETRSVFIKSTRMPSLPIKKPLS